MEIKNLAQLKKAINNGTCFVIRKHYVKPEYSGQKRKPNVIQTNGFYSVIPDEPDNPITLSNNGKGSWIEYGKASEWKFENGLCSQMSHGRKVWDIELI